MNLAGRQIGNYVAKSELGSGGMGVVYLCEHPLIRRRVAAKVLHPEFAASDDIARRLFDEARAANEIDSEHIIQVLDFGRMTEGGSELVYLIMELLEGEALGHRLWRTGLTIEESLHILRQCCEALEASHRAGIVHRDLKPENIFLLDRRGDPNFVKILDFGIAKVSSAAPATRTRTGVLLGTPQYMSPEQCRGASSVDARADVYSLGVVLYELMTGDVPFNADGYGQVLLAQMTEKPRPPTQLNPDLPKAIEEVVLRAMEKDAGARYQSMAELGEAIGDLQALLNVQKTVAQIPRKGLHQRNTFLSMAAPSEANVTPSEVDVASATQVMPTVDEGAMDEAEPSTVLDREVPEAVRALRDQATVLRPAAETSTPAVVSAPLLSTPATLPGRDESGHLVTGPRGMRRPASSIPTELRPVAEDPKRGLSARAILAAVALLLALLGAAYIVR